MVRVVDCHAGVLGSNPGGPRIFSPWNYFTAFYMRAALGFDSLVCCIHYVFHYYPHNYRSDMHDNSFAKRKCSKEIELCIGKPRKN